MIVTQIIGPAFISTDSGATFTAANSQVQKNCASFVDDLHGAMSSYSGTAWSYTNDGGLTWKPSNMTTECWSVYGAPGTSYFYASPESLTDIFRSTDYGASWFRSGSTPGEHAGHITGIGNDVLFCQGRHVCRADPGIAADGFFTSTDQSMDCIPPYNGLCTADQCSECRYVGIRLKCDPSVFLDQIVVSTPSCFAICWDILCTPVADYSWTANRIGHLAPSCSHEDITLVPVSGSPQLCGSAERCDCDNGCAGPLLVFRICGKFPMTITLRAPQGTCFCNSSLGQDFTIN
jgi:hypothetical protein